MDYKPIGVIDCKFREQDDTVTSSLPVELTKGQWLLGNFCKGREVANFAQKCQNRRRTGKIGGNAYKLMQRLEQEIKG